MKKYFILFFILFIACFFILIIKNKDIKETKQVIENEVGYDVEMSPMGKVHFNQVPDVIITIDDNYNDILIALHEEHKIIATGFKNNFYWGFYKSLGFTPNIDKEKIKYLGGQGSFLGDREILYSFKKKFNPKQMVIHVDPYQIKGKKGWDDTTLKDVNENIAPFFANRYSRENIFKGNVPYKFYTINELANKIGEVYQKKKTLQKNLKCSQIN